mmetsp:Transcript_20685/g.58144  ORF Transcript_20685/g.58144 Transcript_20685/m.58144 type:complete len:658 (+) Transcript_20685:99-2072(+)
MQQASALSFGCRRSGALVALLLLATTATSKPDCASFTDSMSCPAGCSFTNNGHEKKCEDTTLVVPCLSSASIARFTASKWGTWSYVPLGSGGASLAWLKACFPHAKITSSDGPFVACDTASAITTCSMEVPAVFPEYASVTSIFFENQCRHVHYPNQVFVGLLTAKGFIGGLLFQSQCQSPAQKSSSKAVEERVCSQVHEDCSHTACCRDPGSKCFKMNDFWATCMPSCTAGPSMLCELVDDSAPDCAGDKDDCIHEGCCKNEHHKCFMKNAGQAFCRAGAPPEDWMGHEIVARKPKGDAAQDGVPRRRSWLDKADESRKRDNGGHESPEKHHEGPEKHHEGPEKHYEDLTKHWQTAMAATHYWDCSGQGCDAAYLNPWVKDKYISPPQYAPMNPDHHGGSVYGEKIWMTGAASDGVSDILGPDVNDCGADNGGGGGCGQCLLVKTNTAANKDWMVVIMKKNRCPPWSFGCEEGKFHMDFAVPGFDNLQYSTANICGNPGTHLSKQQSAICGSNGVAACNCAGIPSHTPALKRLKEGCELFKAWGWHIGTPTMDWRPVPCPKKFVEQVKIGAAFGKHGPVMTLYEEVGGGNTTAIGAGEVGAAKALPRPLARAVGYWPWLAVAAVGGLLAAMGLARGLRAAGRAEGLQPDQEEALIE